MEAVALADVVAETARRHGTTVIDQLELPSFAIGKPDSHGGGRDVEGVPILVRDDDGLIHGRFHAGNITGLTPEAQRALEAFRGVARRTSAVMEVRAEPGSLLMYSNTRGMHRRRRYVPRLDGTDRYFVRLYLASLDVLREHAAHLEGRVFA